MPDPNGSLQQELETAITSAPELQHSPHTALTIASSGGDTTTQAQVVARQQQKAGIQEGLQTQAGHVDAAHGTDYTAGLGGAVKWFANTVVNGTKEGFHIANTAVKKGLGAVGLGGVYRDQALRAQASLAPIGRAVNAPLQEVQHQYRYLHDVEARYGWLAALGLGVGDAVGAVGGTIAAGPEGGVLGAEAMGSLEDRLLYNQSWQRTTDGSTYRDPHTGQLVSFGRDLAGFIGLKPGTGHYSDVSGVLDAIGDLGMDPVQNVGRIYAAAKGVEGAKGILGQTYRGYAFNTDTLDYAKANPDLYKDYFRLLDEGVKGNLRGEAGYWGVLDRRLGPIVGDVHYAADAPKDGEVNVFRHDAVEEVTHRPGHARGAYYSVGDMSLAEDSPYRARGTKVTQMFAKTDRQLRVGTDMSRGESLGHSAASATIDKLYDGGIEAFNRKVSTPDGLADVTNWLGKRGVRVPASATADEVASLYGPALARSKGFASILFDRGRNQELLALEDGVLRSPQAAHVAKGLASAKTVDEAHDVMRGFVKSKEYLSGRLPTLTSMRMPFNELRSMAANMDTDFSDRVTDRFGRLAGMTVGLASPRKWADRFQHLPGMDMDPKTLTFSGKSVDFTKDGLPLDVMDMVRYTQNQNVAIRLGSDWVNADAGGRVQLYRNAVLDSIFGAMGVKLRSGEHAAESYLSTLDPQSQKYLGEWLDKRVHSFSPDASGIFGHTMEDTKTPGVIDRDTDRELGAAIRLSQRGMGAIPSFTEVKRMGTAIAGAKDLFGTLDDFAYKHITQDIFKPLVLQSISYAEHISLAEDIPNLLRLGPSNMLSSALESAYTRLGLKVDERAATEVPEAGADAAKIKALSPREATALRFQTFVHTMLGRVPMNEWRLNRMAEIYAFNGDEGVPPVVLAGHNYGPLENESEKVVRGLREKAESNSNFREGKQYTMIDPTDRRFLRNWKIQLRGMLNDPLQKRALQEYARQRSLGSSEGVATQAAEKVHLAGLRDLPDDTKSFYLRAKHAAKGHDGVDPLESWSSFAVEDMKALTHSHETREPLPFLQSMANTGKTPTIPALKYVEDIDRPRRISGRALVPEGTGRIQRIANYGFRHVLNPMVDELSRHPAFGAEYMKQYRVVEPMVKNGLMSEDEAVTVAMSRSAAETMKFVHNLHDRTQWSETMRNWAPFYFAQEQAYRRMGRLLATNPGAFRQYQLMISNVHDLTVQQQDSEGNSYFVLPGAGFLDRGFVGAFGKWIPIANVNPTEFGGTWSATNVMFPLSQGGTSAEAVRPGWGPVAVVPAKALYSMVSNIGKRYSDFAPIAGKVQSLDNAVIGPVPMSESMLTEMIPNATLQRTLEAVQGYEGNPDRAFASAEMMTMQTLQYLQNKQMREWYDKGQKGPMPRIIPPNDAGYQEKQAFLSRMKNMTFLNFIGRAMIGFVSPVSADVQVQNYGLSQELSNDIASAGSVNQGMQNFLVKNPDATPYTVAQSIHPETGDTLPSSLEGENWLLQNQSFIDKYPEAGMWFMPQLTDTKYNSAVYNEQIADGQRVKRTPQQFLDALYTAAGDQTYYYNLASHESAIKAAGGDKTALDAEYSRWDQYVGQLQQLMPTWAANTTIFSMNRQVQSQQTVSQLQQIFASGQVPKGKMATGLKTLLDSYEVAKAQYVAAGVSTNYSTAQSQVRNQWTTYLQGVEKSNPELTPVIKSVFSGVFYATY